MNTTFFWEKKIKTKKAILLSGLPGIGLVGKIVVDYLIKELKLKRVATIRSESFPASIINKQGLIRPIVDELYYYKVGKQEFYFLAGPVQPGGDFGTSHFADHYEFAKAIINELNHAGVQTVYTLAGIDAGEGETRTNPAIIVAATDETTLKNWKSLGCQTIGGEGVISGAAGMLLLHASLEKMNGACLMAETSSRYVYGDPVAAKSLLQLINKKFSFKVNLDRLDQEIKQIEQEFKKIKKQIESSQEGSSEHLTYVR